jgi:futalosine hydrolase
MILVVSATRAELRHFSAPPGVETVASGVGPVEAAIVAANAIGALRPRIVINAGIAGVFRGRGTVGDAFAIEHEVLAELGIESGEPIVMPDGMRLESETVADAGLVASARAAGLTVGRGITVATITASDTRAAALADRFAADVEAMEGFPVLRAALIAGVPAIEIRGISNFVGARSQSEWDFGAGARATATALAAFLAALPV